MSRGQLYTIQVLDTHCFFWREMWTRLDDWWFEVAAIAAQCTVLKSWVKWVGSVVEDLPDSSAESGALRGSQALKGLEGLGTSKAVDTAKDTTAGTAAIVEPGPIGSRSSCVLLRFRHVGPG
ncbi:unnamed protein product [Prorocentrum cordatum]|uniref:Uncharacterized protein n=1 Tax=Prorocentrum cordatum TaxID=2364126 RepID=A0ABN9V3E5_9DINO|nr:unnamed protein product [Polarella glacialis]